MKTASLLILCILYANTEHPCTKNLHYNPSIIFSTSPYTPEHHPIYKHVQRNVLFSRVVFLILSENNHLSVLLPRGGNYVVSPRSFPRNQMNE